MIKKDREELTTLLDGIEACLELALKMLRNYRQGNKLYRSPSGDCTSPHPRSQVQETLRD